MVLPADIVETINVLQQNMFINAPTISQTAALKCWEDETIEELEGHITKYRSSREFILKELTTIKEIDPENIAPADGGFYVYIDLGEENVDRARGLGSTEMCRLLLEDEGVAFTPGVSLFCFITTSTLYQNSLPIQTDFEDPAGNLGDRRFRISYAGGTNTVQNAMERFHHFWSTKWVSKVRDA
jgi:aspartate/methionine/tyrosine aminotransferase